MNTETSTQTDELKFDEYGDGSKILFNPENDEEYLIFRPDPEVDEFSWRV